MLGIATGMTIAVGGEAKVSAGGSASGAIVSGELEVLSGGLASGAVVMNGGELHIPAGTGQAAIVRERGPGDHRPRRQGQRHDGVEWRRRRRLRSASATSVVSGGEVYVLGTATGVMISNGGDVPGFLRAARRTVRQSRAAAPCISWAAG